MNALDINFIGFQNLSQSLIQSNSSNSIYLVVSFFSSSSKPSCFLQHITHGVANDEVTQVMPGTLVLGLGFGSVVSFKMPDSFIVAGTSFIRLKVTCGPNPSPRTRISRTPCPLARTHPQLKFDLFFYKYF